LWRATCTRLRTRTATVSLRRPWSKDEGAFELAKELVAQKLRELGLNTAEKMRELNVQIDRGVYERTPF
jgi:hypothetical protein